MGESVLVFALDMMRKLTANRWKGGWMGVTPERLLTELRRETRELATALKDRDAAAIIEEAADVANFAMMISEHARNWSADGDGGEGDAT